MLLLRPLAALALAATSAMAAPTRSSPLAVGGGAVFVVNPDSDTVARLAVVANDAVAFALDAPVGRHPRTLALSGPYVFTADQHDDTVWRRDQADLGNPAHVDVGAGCAPYGIAAISGGELLAVSCQGTSELLILDASPAVLARIPLHAPDARALAVSADGATAYVTHFLTREPGSDAHVSVVDVGSRVVTRMFAVPADQGTCETLGSGRGVLNLISAIALVPDGAPTGVAGQLWIGGTLQNNLGKGLFERDASFPSDPRIGLFSFPFMPVPAAAPTRDVFKASLHDIVRSAIYKLDATTGAVMGRIDLDGAGAATDIELSADGTLAYVVDATTNSYHVFGTLRGQAGDVQTLFGPPAAFGAGGADPATACSGDASSVTAEGPFRKAPEARLRASGGYEPLDRTLTPVPTGLDFDTPHFWSSGQSRMRAVPDGVGTGPMGVRAALDGAAFVANYLARNVVALAGGPPDFRCAGTPGAMCATANDCAPTAADCVPLVLGMASSITGADPVHPSLLDGKILFATAARDAAVANGAGLSTAAPPFDDAGLPANRDGVGPIPGSVVSTAREGAFLACTSCHADFGGHDGRTWDFAQFGASLRNTMDLRGRASFAPGTCALQPAVTCFFDAACGDGDACRMDPSLVPPTVPATERSRYFNPMLTVHWNGDRDEVEDFEHTLRSLQGASDCDGLEDTPTCQGALVQRSALTASELPDTPTQDVNEDLGAPNRNLRGPSGRIVGIRLTHLADFVYSLTEFVRNPNPVTDATERGRAIFDDPQTLCASCHEGGPTGTQLFTDKRPRLQIEDPTAPGRGDGNNPFVRHDVGTGNVFDAADPLEVARRGSVYQNVRIPIPGSRGSLGLYVTPVLNDVWNTAPFLHDGSAPTLLDVVRTCDSAVDPCFEPGRGRNVDDQHGRTAFLTPQQLNDLVAFQKSLTTATSVGSAQAVLSLGALEVSRARLRFGKPAGRRRGGRRGTFKIVARLFGAPQPIDPSRGVTLSIATPGGEGMHILSRDLAMKRSGRTFSGRARRDGGTVSLVLRTSGRGAWSAVARGRRLDLQALDTGNPDVTVAFEIGGIQFVRGRKLKSVAGGLRLVPARRR